MKPSAIAGGTWGRASRCSGHRHAHHCSSGCGSLWKSEGALCEAPAASLLTDSVEQTALSQSFSDCWAHLDSLGSCPGSQGDAMTGDLNPGALAWGPGLCNYNHLSRGFSWTSRTRSFAEAKRVPFQVPGRALLGLSLLPLRAGLTGALFSNRSRPAGGT